MLTNTVPTSAATGELIVGTSSTILTNTIVPPAAESILRIVSGPAEILGEVA